MRETCRVSFQPDGRQVFVIKGTTVVEAAGQAGIIINVPCGGRGTCGKCKVQVQQGAHGPSPAGWQHLTAEEIAQGYRLACQTRVERDMTVYIPDAVRLFEQQVLTVGEEREFDVRPNISKCHIVMEPPSVGDLRCDEDRLVEQLAARCSQTNIPLGVLRVLPHVLRKSGFDVTAVINGVELIGLEPGDTGTRLFGAAFDIGTTTLVGLLVDLNNGKTVATVSRTNPQVKYGDDVVSRIKYASENAEGLKEMHESIISAVNEMVAELAVAGHVHREEIYEVTFAGNTAMNHFMLKIDPRWVGQAPYAAVLRRGIYTKAVPMGVHIAPHANIYGLPNIAGFVGGDTVGVILASGLHRHDKVRLAIDIGTNGEVAIGNRERVIVCSCAAGPAFEGARIRYGMRASEGAISKVAIDGDMRIAVIGGGSARGICGSGLIDAVAECLRHGLVDVTGRIVDPGELPASTPEALRRRLVENDDGPAIVLVPADESRIGETILLTQRDLREVQLAKGAIRAGIEILIRRYGVGLDDIEAVLLAGGFGNFIRRSNALRIGLIPPFEHSRISFIGNAALIGAKMALASLPCRLEAAEISETAGYVELANAPEFHEVFADAMMFPESD